MIELNNLSLSYENQLILKNVSCQIESGKVTVLMGKNGCGKSTLLRAMARLLEPQEGEVLLEKQNIYHIPVKKFALRVSLLAQTNFVVENITVEQLVRYGRYPYHHFFSSWTSDDEYYVEQALELTQIEFLRKKTLDSLSGGQRQRAWIAMVLAQDTPYIFLDEPTTYLDLSYQLEVLDLLKMLNQKNKKTIVMVLHDLNLAARYADTIVALNNKKIELIAAPDVVFQKEHIKRIFNLENEVIKDPVHSTPLCIPLSKAF